MSIFQLLQTRFAWLDRDSLMVVGIRALRSLGQSSITLLLALYLSALGYDLLRIGLILSVDIAGTFCIAIGVAFAGNKFKKRHLLAFIMFVAAAASLIVAVTNSLPLLLVAIFLGSFTAGAGAGGPLQPLEVSSIAQVTTKEHRTYVLALLFIAGTLSTALGALLASLPAFTERWFHLDQISAYRTMFVLYAIIQVISAILYLKLSPKVENTMTVNHWTNPFKLRSGKRIFTLAGLFAVDGLGGSLVGQSLVAFWFSNRFGLTLESLSLVFFVSSILTSVSQWAAARISKRIGLLNTMVFTHIPSSIFMIIAAFSPFAWMAVLFWQLRAFLSQMDIPVRESYTMAVVEPEERVAMAAIGGVGRSGASVIGPAAGTALWNALGAATPFVGAGIVKISYDIMIFALFRKIKPPEEEHNARVATNIKTT